MKFIPYPPAPVPSQAVALLGVTKHGKTATARHWMKAWGRLTLYYHSTGPNSVPLGALGDPRLWRQRGVVTVRWPDSEDPLEVWRGAFYLLLAARRSGVGPLVVMEECGLYATLGRVAYQAADGSRKSGDLGVLTSKWSHVPGSVLVWIAQRPVFLHPSVRSQCTTVYTWKQVGDDVVTLRKLRPAIDPRRVSLFGRGEWCAASNDGTVRYSALAA